MSTVASASDPRIIVGAMMLDGRGDVYAAKKIADLLERRGFDTGFAVFKLRNEDFRRQLQQDQTVEAIQTQERNWVILDGDEMLRRGWNNDCDLMILFPNMALIDFGLTTFPREKMILFSEYSCPDRCPANPTIPLYTLGLGDDEEGILLPEAPLELPSTSATSTERLAKLRETQPALAAKILHREELDSSSELFFAYFATEFYFSHFVQTVFQLASDKSHIVIVTSKPCIIQDAEHLLEFGQNLEGLKQIEFISSDSTLSTRLFDENQNRTIKIISTSLNCSELDSIIAASADEVLATGDSSWIELMAANKVVVYDPRAHKRPSAMHMANLLHQTSPILADLMKQAYLGDPTYHNAWVLQFDRIGISMLPFLETLRSDPQAREHWKTLVRKIFTHNAADKIAIIVRQHLPPSS